MNIRYVALCTAAVFAAIALQGTAANAMSMTDCSAKYKAAKAANTLNGMKWNDFRKAQCADNAAAPAAAAPAPATASAPPPPAPHPSRPPQRQPQSAAPCSRARLMPNIRRIPPARPDGNLPRPVQSQ